MNAKAADAAPLAAGFAFASNCSEFLYGAETLRTRTNICFQCGFECDCRNDDAQNARDQHQIEAIMGSSFGMVGSSFGADGEWQVSNRAGHGFEMVDLSESRSPGTGIIRNSAREFGNFFAKPARIKPNAITCDLSRNVSQALDCETTVID